MWLDKEKVLLMLVLGVLAPDKAASIDSNGFNNLVSKLNEEIAGVKNELGKDLSKVNQKLNAQEKLLSKVVAELEILQSASNSKLEEETNSIEKDATVMKHSTKGRTNPLDCIINSRILNCITIQHRFNGWVSFDRLWKKYKDGFGKAPSEFWLGLQNIFETVQYGSRELLIVQEDFNGVVTHAHYNNFTIGNEDEQYALKSLGQYSGTAGDSMRELEGAPFTLCYQHKPIMANQGKTRHNRKRGAGWWTPKGTGCKLGYVI
ncbi:AGAP012000-PA-like protein [Anopheles sinensis]|uniref:AGAP012000-PA-like protein n=1 Tax=Anopheles sinensis TaxID=74873 RepID=A0A084W6B5_ANOSI|nr:AGAP012000-PA-like protein [Anopheles sinensis]